MVIILIIAVAMASRPAERKIQGTWQLIEGISDNDYKHWKDDGEYVTYVFSKGYLIIYDHDRDRQEEGYYKIDGDILELYDDRYRENHLWGNSDRYIIEKLSNRELIIRKVDSSSGKKYIFKKH